LVVVVLVASDEPPPSDRAGLDDPIFLLFRLLLFRGLDETLVRAGTRTRTGHEAPHTHKVISSAEAAGDGRRRRPSCAPMRASTQRSCARPPATGTPPSIISSDTHPRVRDTLHRTAATVAPAA